MAKTLKVDITAISPLNIGGKKPYGHFLETLDYIPGSVARGAFAKLLMTSNRKLFDKLFVESQDVIRFGNFYPKSPLDVPDIPLVLPMTAVSCKYESGFCTGYDELEDETEKPPHGVFDILIMELIFEHFGEQLPFAYQPICPKCGARVEPFAGYYDAAPSRFSERSPSDCKPNNNEFYQTKFKCSKGSCLRSYQQHECRTQRVTKSAINRQRNVVEEEMLYSVEAIRPDTDFSGIVTISDDNLVEEIKQHLNLLNQSKLGSGGSRGFGKIEITNIRDYNLDSTDELKARILAFNRKIDEVAESYQVFLKEPLHLKKWYFTIGFQSDAIILDEFGRSSPILTSEKLKELLCLPDVKICLKRYYSRMSERGGWSFAWNLLKEKEAVLEKGSVFLFWTPDIESLYEPLARLQINGVGEKREEGLGQIIVCDAFHQEVYCS